MRALCIATLAAAAVIGLAACGPDTVAPEGKGSAGSNASSTEVPSSPPVSTLPNQPTQKTSPSAPVSISPSGVVVPHGVTKVAAAKVDVSALPAYFEHRGEVWVFDGGYSLAMFAMASSGCTDAQAVVTDQEDTAIRIMLRPLPRPLAGQPDGGACTAVMTPRPVAVRLDAPLGDRTIYLAIGR
jgi:hypothetical protein